jgi:pimeloyl-ACP methyl ester carboxylesterase
MTTQAIEVSGGKIAFDDTQTGSPLVVAMPGAADVRGEYRFLAPLLVKAGMRVVTVDPRGVGESSAQWPEYTPTAVGNDVIALLRQLDAGPAVLVGASATPASAIWIAAEAPELVSKIVLISPHLRAPKINLLMKLAIPVVFHGPWAPGSWGRYYKSLHKANPPADLAEYTSALIKNLKEPGRFAAARALLMDDKKSAIDRMPEVSVPSLAIFGSADPDFEDTTEEAAWVHSQLDSESMIVEGAGHYPHVEFPEQVAERITGFVNGPAA